MQLPCCPGNQAEFSENRLQNLRNDLMARSVEVTNIFRVATIFYFPANLRLPFVVLNAKYRTEAIDGALAAHVDLGQLKMDPESETRNLNIKFTTVSRVATSHHRSESLIQCMQFKQLDFFFDFQEGVKIQLPNRRRSG